MSFVGTKMEESRVDFACKIVAALFVAGLIFNLGALEHTNVETLIVARSCLPLVTSILDYIFLGRQVSILLFIYTTVS